MKMPPRYWTGHPLLRLRLPWLTPGAIEALLLIAQPIQSVLEFGSGGSTLFFSDRCHIVVSWERDLKWRKLIEKQVKPNRLCVFSDNLEDALTSGPHDLVLVDNKGADREAIARRAINQVRPGGWFIFDNYARYNLDFLNGWKCQRYDDPHWSGKGTLICNR